MRKQLEKKNEEMVSKKIEDMRIDAETKLTKKLYKAFDGGLKTNDQVSTASAAPVRAVVAQKIVPENKKERKNKAILNLGMNTMDGNGVSVSDSLKVGLSFESMIQERVSIGVGLSLASMTATDTAEYNYFYEGREVDYKRLALEVNSKFYLTVGSMIKPYVGAGLAYNRTTVEYNESNNSYASYNSLSYYDSYYDNEDSSLTTGNLGAAALLGVEIGIAESFAMSLDFKYSKDLSSGTDEDVNLSYISSNEQKLKNITANIEDSDQLSINAGVIFKF